MTDTTSGDDAERPIIRTRTRTRVPVTAFNPHSHKTDEEDNDILKRRARLPDITQEQQSLRTEQQVARCEILMIKGWKSPIEIMRMLGVNTRAEVQSLMDKVLARWEITGQGRDLARYRGEAVGRVEHMMQEAFVAFQDVDNDVEVPDETEEANVLRRNRPASVQGTVKAKVALLRTMTVLNKQWCELNGLSAKNIARSMAVTADGSEFVARMKKQERLAETARKFLSFLRTEVENGDNAKPVVIDNEVPQHENE